MPARNILCTLYEYISPEHKAQSENPAEINSIFSRRNDASISKHCVSRSLSFLEIRDYFDRLLHGDVDGEEKNRSTQTQDDDSKNDGRYLFIAREIRHTTSRRRYVFLAKDQLTARNECCPRLYSAQRSIASALSFHSSCIIWLSPRYAWIVHTAASWNVSKSRWERGGGRKEIGHIIGRYRKFSLTYMHGRFRGIAP